VWKLHKQGKLKNMTPEQIKMLKELTDLG